MSALIGTCCLSFCTAHALNMALVLFSTGGDICGVSLAQVPSEYLVLTWLLSTQYWYFLFPGPSPYAVSQWHRPPQFLQNALCALSNPWASALLFHLPGIIFIQITSWIILALPSGLCSYNSFFINKIIKVATLAYSFSFLPKHITSSNIVYNCIHLFSFLWLSPISSTRIKLAIPHVPISLCSFFVILIMCNIIIVW